MTAWVSAWLGRVIGAVVAGLVVWLADKGIEMTQEEAHRLTEGIMIIFMVIFNVVYSLVHKFANNKLNPADSASSRKVDP